MSLTDLTFDFSLRHPHVGDVLHGTDNNFWLLVDVDWLMKDDGYGTTWRLHWLCPNGETLLETVDSAEWRASWADVLPVENMVADVAGCRS